MAYATGTGAPLQVKLVKISVRRIRSLQPEGLRWEKRERGEIWLQAGARRGTIYGVPSSAGPVARRRD